MMAWWRFWLASSLAASGSSQEPGTLTIRSRRIASRPCQRIDGAAEQAIGNEAVEAADHDANFSPAAER
jgi:hypothetical protein